MTVSFISAPMRSQCSIGTNGNSQGSSNLKSYYNVVFDQQFSPLGKHLATSDIFGQIAVFRYSPQNVH